MEIKKINPVEQMLQQQENTLGQQIAMKAIDMVKPMLKSCANELSNFLGDNGKMIVIRKTKQNSPVSILVLDTHENFSIIGGENFSFTGEGDPVTKRPRAILKYYTAEEFVELLLAGKMNELTQKLMT